MTAAPVITVSPTTLPTPEPTAIPTLTTYELITFTMLGVPESLFTSSIYSTFTLVAASEALITALQRANDNRTVAARILGVSRRTLYNKLEEYRLL